MPSFLIKKIAVDEKIKKKLANVYEKNTERRKMRPDIITRDGLLVLF